MPKQNQIVIAILAVLAVIAGAIYYFNMAEGPDGAMTDADSGTTVASTEIRPTATRLLRPTLWVS